MERTLSPMLWAGVLCVSALLMGCSEGPAEPFAVRSTLETPARARVYVRTGTWRQMPYDERGPYIVHAHYFEIAYRLDGQGGWGRAESVRSVGEDDAYEQSDARVPGSASAEECAAASWKPGSGPVVPQGFTRPYRIKETADGTAILAASGSPGGRFRLECSDWVVADRQGEHRMPTRTDLLPTTWDAAQHQILFAGYSCYHRIERRSTPYSATRPVQDYFVLVWNYQSGSLRLYQLAVADDLGRLAKTDK